MLFVVLCALSISACTDDRPITFEQLPDKAQALLTQYANPAEIMFVVQDGYGPFADYDVTMNNMDKWEFKGNGTLDKVEMMSSVIRTTPLSSTRSIATTTRLCWTTAWN